MNDITDYHKNQHEDNFLDNMQELAWDFGEQIQQAREEQNHTRKELANLLNIKQSHLKNIEEQKMQPDVDLQKKIERTLGIDLNAEDY